MLQLVCKKRAKGPLKQCLFVEDDPILTLLDYWYELYFRRYGVRYEYGRQTKSDRYKLIFDFYVAIGRDFQKAQKIFRAFLQDPGFDWVDAKTLNWVTKTSNLVFILPKLSVNRKNLRPNWTDPRGKVQTVVAV